MAKGQNEQEKQEQIHAAHEAGMSASEAGVSTGASKQVKHLPHSEREPKRDAKT